MTSATKRLTELLVAPSDSESELETRAEGDDPELIVLGLEDVELVEGRRVARSEHRFRTSRITPRRDRSRRSSAPPPRPANDLVSAPPVLPAIEPDLPGTARIALTMMTLLFIAGVVIVLNPAL